MTRDSPSVQVLIRYDGSAGAGLGHLMRSCSIGQALRDFGIRVLVAITQQEQVSEGFVRSQGLEPILVETSGDVDGSSETQIQDASEVLKTLDSKGLSPQVVIVDHYGLSRAWENVMASRIERLVVIDDYPERPHVCHVLVDQNAAADVVSAYRRVTPVGCKFLLGGRFASLASDYRQARLASPPSRECVGHLVINFGGVDQPELMQMAVNAARDVFGESVVIRQISRSDGLVSLASEFRAADLAIGAAGSSSWERVCLGLPSVVVPIAQNQLAVARELHRRGFAMVVEPQGTQLEQQILLALTRFTDGEELAAMAERCWSSEIDGLGALRVGIAAASHLLALTMRPVVLSDADRLLDWRNDPLVVSNSQSHNRIDIDEHEHWLKETLARPDLHRWMIATVSDQVAIGQVRFDLREGCWWMTYSVDQKFRGLGVGVALIKAGLRILAEERVSQDVAAVVRASNQASLKTLDRVGFRRSTRSTLYEYANASNLRDLEVHLFDLRRDA